MPKVDVFSNQKKHMGWLKLRVGFLGVIFGGYGFEMIQNLECISQGRCNSQNATDDRMMHIESFVRTSGTSVNWILFLELPVNIPIL